MFRLNIFSLVLGLFLAVLASALPHKRQGMADEAFHVRPSPPTHPQTSPDEQTN